MKTRSKNTPRGFTLIELLVAMAITTVIVTVLVSVTAMALDTWNRSRAEIRAARQAKAMIDSMAHDFESFVSRSGNSFEWLYAKSVPLTGPQLTPSPNAIELIFFSAATDRYDGNIGTTHPDNKGDVSAVGYKMTYKDPITGEDEDKYKTFVLYRKIVNPDVTFTNILGQTAIKAPFDLAGASIEAETNFICENVYQFTVTFHVSDVTNALGAVSSITVPVGLTANSASEFNVMGSGIESDYVPAGFTLDLLKTGRLSAAEISITVISDFGLQQMRRRSDLTGINLAEFIAKHSYEYSKVVQLPGS